MAHLVLTIGPTLHCIENGRRQHLSLRSFPGPYAEKNKEQYQ